MKIVGLVSTYADGWLVASAVESLHGAVDEIAVFDGPVEQALRSEGELHEGGTPVRTLRKSARVYYERGRWTSDAAKRTALLRWAHSRHASWALWLDGDEVLVHGAYLRDLCDHADARSGPADAAGIMLRIVEFDGSVSGAPARLFRPRPVARFLTGSYEFELRDGTVVAAPHRRLCFAGGVPFGRAPGTQLPDPELEAWLGEYRPPVPGEPCILHRAALRDPARQGYLHRLSEVETR